MRKNLRSYIYIFMAMVLIIGSLVGCGRSTSQESEATQSTVGQSQSESESADGQSQTESVSADGQSQTESESTDGQSQSESQTGEVQSQGTVDLSQAIEQLRGKKFGVIVGTIFDEVIEENIPDCQLEYYNIIADLAGALEAGKIDAYVTDEPIARLLVESYPSHCIYCLLADDNYGYIYAKDSSKGDILRSQMDEFLTKIREDGTQEELDDIWFGDDESVQVVDYTNMSGENGELNFACATTQGAPFCYLKDGNIIGYDLDIAVRFCREYGYSINVCDSDFAGILAAVTSGKCDFGASCISITEERKESMNFSIPNYYGGIAVVTINPEYADSANTGLDATDEIATSDTNASETDVTEGAGADITDEAGTNGEKVSNDSENTEKGFWNSVKESFVKTFIREDRWKIFLSGIGTTLLITLMAAIGGTLIGFLIFMIYRKDFGVFNCIINILCDILQKTPIVVILMIMYYIIFAGSKLEGVWVSCIVFVMVFACSVTKNMKVAVDAVDPGQMEAAKSIGFTETQSFMRIILPQALRHFLPIYQGEIVNLIKSTAIVGYITVQDLTRVSDIIRSRTYEAFFPLIASAVVYFGIAWLLTLIVMNIQISIDPRHRKTIKILKGVHAK